MKKVSSIEEYIEVNSHYKKELEFLRGLILGYTELEEQVKWNSPVYEINGKKLIGLGAFKNHFCLWFYYGVFFNDENNLLYQASETTKGLRQLRYQTFDEIDEKSVRNFIQQAIQFKDEKLPEESKSKEIVIPEILEKTLTTNKKLADAFSSFTPFKQKEFTEYIDSAKQEKTKQSRLEKIIPMIKQGIGLNDKYR